MVEGSDGGRLEAWKWVSGAYMSGKYVAVAKFTSKQEEGCGEEEAERMLHSDPASGTLEPGGWEAGQARACWGRSGMGGWGSGTGVSLISSRWVSLSDGARWQGKMGPAVVGGSVEV